MAGCFHDQQEFECELKIEVAREDDILKEDQELKDIKCKKNPGHEGFIPFKDLSLEHLPRDHRNIEILDQIKQQGSHVVRLVVDKIKNGKEIREVGSGYVEKIINEYFIQTNNHVVGTDDEVTNCTVEFHYDSVDRTSVFTSRGVKLRDTNPFRDTTSFTFHPVAEFLHQLDWKYDKRPYIVIMNEDNQMIFEGNSHHETQVPFFTHLNLNNSDIDIMFIKDNEGTISYFKSCYFKFEPIASNIQKFTSISICIGEDDGNIRAIQGDVVKFDDEFVVKISESIFQDEAKKCRLVWNGQVIGRGTRLYFQHVGAREYFRDSMNEYDLEWVMKMDPYSFCLFDMHPKTEYFRNSELKLFEDRMCCIGHPHGGIKMVTFGQYLRISEECFDNQYRRIREQHKDCKCKKVSCLNYSAKTCLGSSGSLVIDLGEKRFVKVTLTHFMGERVNKFLPDNKLIENINIAWIPHNPTS